MPSQMPADGSLSELRRSAGLLACLLEGFRQTVASVTPAGLSRQLWPEEAQLQQEEQDEEVCGLPCSSHRTQVLKAALPQDAEQGSEVPELRSDLLGMHTRRKASEDGPEDVVLAVETWSSQEMRVVTLVSFAMLALAAAALVACVAVKCRAPRSQCSCSHSTSEAWLACR